MNYMPFQDDSKESKLFKQKYRVFPRVTEKRHSRQSPPPNVQLTFLVGKIDM